MPLQSIAYQPQDLSRNLLLAEQIKGSRQSRNLAEIASQRQGEQLKLTKAKVYANAVLDLSTAASAFRDEDKAKSMIEATCKIYKDGGVDISPESIQWERKGEKVTISHRPEGAKNGFELSGLDSDVLKYTGWLKAKNLGAPGIDQEEEMEKAAEMRVSVKELGPSFREKEKIKQEVKKDVATPTTAMGAFLNQKPDASPDEIAVFAQKLKGKGITATLPDGTVIEIGGAAGGPESLTKPVQTELQKDVISLTGQLAKLKDIRSKFQPEYLTYAGKLKGVGLRVLNKAGRKLTAADRTFLSSARKFKQGVESVFNQYRKEITGAAAAIQELESLKNAIINMDLAPDEFVPALDQYESELQRSLRLKNKFLRQGIQPGSKDFGDKFDDAFLMGNDDSINDRGEELKALGLSEDEVFKKLREEGYTY